MDKPMPPPPKRKEPPRKNLPKTESSIFAISHPPAKPTPYRDDYTPGPSKYTPHQQESVVFKTNPRKYQAHLHKQDSFQMSKDLFKIFMHPC